MNLQTQIKLPDYPFTISHQDKVLSFGSCFSENIGDKLKEHKFDVLVNPYGILFNPISVCTAINECLENKSYLEADLNNNKEIHFSFNHHSRFAGLNKAEVLESINSSISQANSYLSDANVVVLTFGTAWVYRLKETNQVVANCYKLPNTLFNKELLSINEIVAEVSDSINKLRSVNPSVKIITTITYQLILRQGMLLFIQVRRRNLMALFQTVGIVNLKINMLRIFQSLSPRAFKIPTMLTLSRTKISNAVTIQTVVLPRKGESKLSNHNVVTSINCHFFIFR